MKKAGHDQKVNALPFSCHLVRSGARSLAYAQPVAFRRSLGDGGKRIILRCDFGSMRQNLDRSTTPHMLKRSTCGFVIAKPLCARQVHNLPHTSENAADFHARDESRSPLERSISPDKTDQNKPVPFWQVTLPQRARRIPGPGGTGVKFAALQS